MESCESKLHIVTHRVYNFGTNVWIR